MATKLCSRQGKSCGWSRARWEPWRVSRAVLEAPVVAFSSHSRTAAGPHGTATMRRHVVDLTKPQPAKKQRTLFDCMERLQPGATLEERRAALEVRLAPEVVEQQQEREAEQEVRRQESAAAAASAAAYGRMGTGDAAGLVGRPALVASQHKSAMASSLWWPLGVWRMQGACRGAVADG